jgi:hypothetical protein
MKKMILTAAIALTTVFGIATSTYAATGSNTGVSTMLTDVNNISEIEVHGNVQVYLTTGNEDKVKVYDNYYAENALVQEQNGVLRITSYTTDKLVVWVTVNNLSKLSVYDDARVKSFGKFSTLNLDVDLHDHALAQLDMDIINASFKVQDHAKADLSGFVENGRLVSAPTASLNISGFSTARVLKAAPSKCFKNDELASL